MNGMTTYEWMEILLLGILLLVAYLVLLQNISRRVRDRRTLPAVAMILFFIFLCVTIALYVVLRFTGGIEQILFVVLMVVSVIVLGKQADFVVHNFREINKGALALFLTYLLAILYVTLFSRWGVHNTSVKTGLFTDMGESLHHLVLNIALFLPFGLLLPAVNKKRQTTVLVILTGMMLSTFIETVQMFLQIGESVSRWALMIGAIVMMYILVQNFPDSAKIIFVFGILVMVVLLLVGSFAKTFVLGKGLTFNESVQSYISVRYINEYFSGIFPVAKHHLLRYDLIRIL